MDIVREIWKKKSSSVLLKQHAVTREFSSTEHFNSIEIRVHLPVVYGDTISLTSVTFYRGIWWPNLQMKFKTWQGSLVNLGMLMDSIKYTKPMQKETIIISKSYCDILHELKTRIRSSRDTFIFHIFITAKKKKILENIDRLKFEIIQFA